MRIIRSALALALAGVANAAGAAYPVAGLAPYERPAGAPVIKAFERSETWRAQALRGVSQPPPESVLRFLDSQGAWYTPFTHAGMPGYYDLRGLHEAKPAKR